MKIIELRASNVKRLKAVTITPDGPMVVVSGRNAQGKSSVLDAIWMALGGGAAQKDTARPIRDGENQAEVRLDLGDFIVTRRWVGEKSTLTVMSKDGAKYGSPQAFLDEKLGRLSFDPLAFSLKPDKEQVADLLSLVSLPFDPVELDARRRGIFDERTEVGREVKVLEGQLDGIEDPGDVGDSAPDPDPIRQELREARTGNADRDNVEAVLAEWRGRLRRAKEEVADAEKAIKDAVRVLDEMPGTIDIDEIEERMNATYAASAAHGEAVLNRRRHDELKERRSVVHELTKQLQHIAEEKATALSKAEMPIDGLSFDDEGVTYQGIPFRQCSAAERLRVSVAMALAMNPTIKVIRITDGSLLDRENLALIEEMVKGRDAQCWIERVEDESGVGFVVEDGEIRADA